MRIEIAPDVQYRYRFDFERHITKLLSIVPPEHLRRLEKVVVVNSWKHKKYSSVRGVYLERPPEGGGPVIVLDANAILGQFPFFARCIPLVYRMALATSLYHEIGHHYQKLRPGIKREDWEQNAEQYARALFQKAFWSYRWAIVPLRIFLKPVKMLAHLALRVGKVVLAIRRTIPS